MCQCLTLAVGFGEELVPRDLGLLRQRLQVVSGLHVDDAVQILLSWRPQDACRGTQKHAHWDKTNLIKYLMIL